MSAIKYNSGSGGSCGCLLLILIFNLLLGGVSVNYCMESLTGQSIDFLVAAIIGLFLGEFTIPLAIIFLLLRLCGVPSPFIH